METNLGELLQKSIDIAKQAGDAIMQVYQRDFTVEQKQDDSPLTEADLASHNVIVSGLENISNFPILSEESAEVSWEERRQWSTFWLIDPLDGTKEFIKKNGEFTVNIALISDGKPILGVVYAPALNETYYGAVGYGSYIQENSEEPRTISPVSFDSGEVIKVVGSRSHQSPEIKGYLDSLPSTTELMAMGSSLKLCLVASGAAHLYPRLGPTSEWDTAAAHAVVSSAGGKVTILEQNSSGIYQDSGRPLTYNQKENILNPYFLVSA